MISNTQTIIFVIFINLIPFSVYSDAICRDGWYSHSTGRGTCSHHGGVSSRIANDKIIPAKQKNYNNLTSQSALNNHTNAHNTYIILNYDNSVTEQAKLQHNLNSKNDIKIAYSDLNIKYWYDTYSKHLSSQQQNKQSIKQRKTNNKTRNLGRDNP